MIMLVWNIRAWTMKMLMGKFRVCCRHGWPNCSVQVSSPWFPFLVVICYGCMGSCSR